MRSRGSNSSWSWERYLDTEVLIASDRRTESLFLPRREYFPLSLQGSPRREASAGQECSDLFLSPLGSAATLTAALGDRRWRTVRQQAEEGVFLANHGGTSCSSQGSPSCCTPVSQADSPHGRGRLITALIMASDCTKAGSIVFLCPLAWTWRLTMQKCCYSVFL